MRAGPYSTISGLRRRGRERQARWNTLILALRTLRQEDGEFQVKGDPCLTIKGRERKRRKKGREKEKVGGEKGDSQVNSLPLTLWASLHHMI